MQVNWVIGARAAMMALAALACCHWPLVAQMPALQPVDAFSNSGTVTIDGKPQKYKVEHLPASSFPMLPPAVAVELNRRECLIPQTYEAHGPENVIHGSFKHAGETDWAVLCSVHGTVSLLVFFEGAAETPAVVSSAPETARLQLNNSTGEFGFDWGIDVASPEQVHEAQLDMRRRPPRLDHDAVASSIIDGETTYRFFNGSIWTILDTSD